MRNLGLWQAVIVASQLGFIMAAAVAVGLLVGWYLDSLVHTTPILTIVGAIVGMVAGLFSCVQIARDVLGNKRS